MVQQCKILLVIFVTFVVILIFALVHLILRRPAKIRKTAEMMCKEYMEYNYPIAPRTAVVWSGKPVRPGLLPHMALIFALRDGLNKTMCGGTLISKNFLLTAGHCANKMTDYGAKIYLGIDNLNDIGEAEEFKNEEVHFYKGATKYNELYDIALIKLNREVEFNTHIRPTCLNTQMNLQLEQLTSAGWGRYESNSYSSQLRIVELEWMPDSECEQQYPDRFFQPYFICAGHPTEHKDVCEGDSGGPLQLPIVLKNEIEFVFLQVGIVSHGIACAIPGQTRILGSYTKVAYYIPWIESIVWS